MDCGAVTGTAGEVSGRGTTNRSRASETKRRRTKHQREGNYSSTFNTTLFVMTPKTERKRRRNAAVLQFSYGLAYLLRCTCSLYIPAAGLLSQTLQDFLAASSSDSK